MNTVAESGITKMTSVASDKYAKTKDIKSKQKNKNLRQDCCVTIGIIQVFLCINNDPGSRKLFEPEAVRPRVQTASERHG